MSANHQSNALFRSRLVWVGDYRCRPRDHGCCGEEHSDEDDIAFVRRGTFLKHVGRSEFCADANHVIFFNHHEPYRVSHPVDGGDDCTVISLDRDLLRSMVAHIDAADGDPTRKLHRFAVGPCAPTLFLAQSQLFRRMKRGRCMDLAVEEEAIALVEAAIASAYRIRGLRTGPKKGSSRRAHADWATAAKLVLAARFAESLSLDELATAVHVSPYHLCRVFRQQTGLSIRTYRQQLRQRAALQRLAETNDDLTRIALGLGFTDHSHFTHCFSSAFGISPSAFRRSAAMPLIREMSKNLQVG